MLNKFIFQAQKLLEGNSPNQQFTEAQLSVLRSTHLHLPLVELRDKISQLRKNSPKTLLKQHSASVIEFINEFLISIRKTQLDHD